MAKQLPSKPNLEFDKKQAKALLKAFDSGDDEAIERVKTHLPHVREKSLEDVREFPLKLTQAQLVIAREYGYESWGALRLAIKLKNRDYGESLDEFKGAIYGKDAKKVDQILSDHPELKDTLDDPHFFFGSTAVIISKQQWDVVEVLLKHGANINAKSQWWAGDFHVLEGVDSSLAKKLIDAGAEINVHAAAEQGWIDWLETAYADNPDIVNERGGDGKVPLHYATDIKVIDWLLAHGADIDIRDEDHNSTPLQWMIASKKPEVVKALVERGAQVDIFAAIALNDRSRLEQILRDDPSAVRARVDEPGYAPVPTADGLHQYAYVFSSGVSPHQVAIQMGHTALFDLMIAHSPQDIQFVAYCAKGDRENAEKIRAQQPDILSTLRPVDQQQLVHSAWNHQTQAVDLMLDMGFDPHITDKEKLTPLHRAAFHGFADIVEILLRKDPNPPLDWLNQYEGTPLTTALFGHDNGWRKDGDYPRTLNLLVDAGSEFKAEWLPQVKDEFKPIVERAIKRGAKS